MRNCAVSRSFGSRGANVNAGPGLRLRVPLGALRLAQYRESRAYIVRVEHFVADRSRPLIAGASVPGEIEPEWPRG
jgi:hypothetical protein